MSNVLNFHRTVLLSLCLLLACVTAACVTAARVTAARGQETRVTAAREVRLAEASAERGRGAVRQLRPLMRKGEPIFAIGAYSFPRGMIEDWGAVRKGGWNTIVAREARYSKAEAGLDLLKKAEGKGLAIIVDAHDLVKGRQREAFVDYVEAARAYDSFWGIYLMDEPENVFWSNKKKAFAGDQFNTWLRRRGVDPEDGEKRVQNLDRFIVQRLMPYKKDFDEAVSAEDRYVFTALGWDDFYTKLGAVTDVNMANTYSSWDEEKQRGKNVAKVVWDARNAARAAEKAGRRPFIWTPLALDNWSRRQPQILFRHDSFAAITQGAMGVVYWAGYRSSKKYAQGVVFPVTRELQQLSPFFLGPWMDQRLRWSPQDRGTEELEKFDVPRVSACLRKGPEGRYLLLAVNNTEEPTRATFEIDVDGLSSSATEFLKQQSVPVAEGRQISDELGPYAVKAYVLEER